MQPNAEDSIRRTTSSPTGSDQQSSTAFGISSSPTSNPQVLKFVKMMSLTMADQLRTVVLNSVDAFVEFWNRFDVQEMSKAYYAGNMVHKKPHMHKTQKCSMAQHTSIK